jgi:hypothetical protein
MKNRLLIFAATLTLLSTSVSAQCYYPKPPSGCFPLGGLIDVNANAPFFGYVPPSPNDSWIVNVDGQLVGGVFTEVSVRITDDTGTISYGGFVSSGAPDEGLRTLLVSRIDDRKDVDVIEVGRTTLIIDLKKGSTITNVQCFWTNPGINMASSRVNSRYFAVIDVDPLTDITLGIDENYTIPSSDSLIATFGLYAISFVSLQTGDSDSDLAMTFFDPIGGPFALNQINLVTASILIGNNMSPRAKLILSSGAQPVDVQPMNVIGVVHDGWRN